MRRALALVALLLAASPLFSATLVRKLVVKTDGESKWAGPCPHQFDFEAEITVRKKGDILVQWIRSDGVSGAATTLHFSAPDEMLKVADHWVVSKKYHGWEQLKVTDPAGNVSLSKRAGFSNSCR